ncbi:MAG: (Fe-S)-binding protein [Desulfobacula sp.]|jgi:heterodisulfide reductase subunit D|nr:(Fe-S)-binding protein [Desulfobacula sp.]
MVLKNYSIPEILQMEACTNCTLCAEVCPAVSALQDGRLSGVYRLDTLRGMIRSQSRLFQFFSRRKPPTRTELKKFGETVYRCTLCGRCQEICPSGIKLRDIWFSLRQDLVCSGAYPEKINMIRENVALSHNVFDEDNKERVDWVDDLQNPPDHYYVKDTAEVVYFTGCVAAFFPMVQKIPIALTQLFETAKIDFTLLGEEEWCCGFPLLAAGLRNHIKDPVQHNIEAVRRKGAQKVVFACPSCYQMWKEYYPEEFEIYHVSQFLNSLIDTGQLELSRLDLKITYHDPCDLGRGSMEYDAPREVINAIPGVSLIEMEHNRDKCLCCGGGGNLEMIDTHLSRQIAETKINEVLATGADAVVTACQQCLRTILSYARRNKIKIEVLDIVELIHRSVKKD